MDVIDKVKNICKHYTVSTNITCKFIEIENISNDEFMVGCPLCVRLKEMETPIPKCMDIFKYSYYQAERFGGKYIFYCSTGLVYWCSIVKTKDLKGLVVAGPVTIINSQEFVEDEVFPQINEIEGKVAIELYNLTKQIPYIEPNVLTSLSFILHNSIQYEMENQSLLVELDKNFVDNVNTLKGIEEVARTYSIDKEKELLLLIKQSNEKKAKEVLNEILASLFVDNGMNLKILRSRVLELVVLLSRAVAEIGVDIEEVFGVNCYLLDDINRIEELEDLLRWSNYILNKFMDLVFGLKDIKSKDIIFKAVTFINKNYMCHITLEEVSEFVALSPAYFSSIFKKEIKINFSDYLNKVRIDNSKKLLKNNSIKLVEVAYLVGFESQSYFSKMFKKREGVTPKQYRQLNIL